jgi:hypothetical protein
MAPWRIRPQARPHTHTHLDAPELLNIKEVAVRPTHLPKLRSKTKDHQKHIASVTITKKKQNKNKNKNPKTHQRNNVSAQDE